MIPVIIDEDEINKDGEVIDEENQENDQTRNIGLDDTKQNNLAEINGEFIEAVEEIDLKFDEMEASEGHYHIDKEMEEVEMEKEAKRGTEEEAIEELRDEREKVVSHVETEEIERVGELVKDKEDHTGSTLKEELTVAVNTVMGAKEWKVATKAHFKKYLETISKPIDTMQIFNATGQMLRKAENNKNMREFRSEVRFVEIFQKRNLCCGHFVEKEELVKCDQCEHFYHETCREMGWGPTGECKCRRPEFLGTKYTSSLLPTNRMSEKLTNAMPEAYKNQVEIRVVANEMRNGTIGERLTDFCKKYNIAVPQHKFRYKMILVFLKPDEAEEDQDKTNDEALIFIYTVHEFVAGEETTPKSKWTVLGYLDSNRYITDGIKRQLIFQGIVLSYFLYAASAGYEMCHFRCAAPGNDNYLFNDPMLNKKLRPDQIRLLKWYSNILNSGKTRGIIKKWERKSVDSKGMSLQDLLEKFYLDGGYWPKRIEKILEKEMKPEKLREELVKEISNDSDAFFVDLSKQDLIKDSTPVIPTMDMTRSKEDFLAVQVQSGLRYSTNRLLWYSTARTI
ncbi:Protein CBG16323 [Caenorhabditis briggsae]|uniref:histone acetyltransferase n=1 Tax=Caenorhabditis briggsae TaxID=6238 RepID=A8XNP3_CAEBR|nr:Protein CBG16323 [Caenorhabditis briggsae]CAP34132.1 Protein CBG16323 [Caenorhabditis briggsae]